MPELLKARFPRIAVLVLIFPLYLFLEGSGDHRDLHSFPTRRSSDLVARAPGPFKARLDTRSDAAWHDPRVRRRQRSEEHTSELQSRQYLVCRLLLEKKKGFRKNADARKIEGYSRSLRRTFEKRPKLV